MKPKRVYSGQSRGRDGGPGGLCSWRGFRGGLAAGDNGVASLSLGGGEGGDSREGKRGACGLFAHLAHGKVWARRIEGTVTHRAQTGDSRTSCWRLGTGENRGGVGTIPKTRPERPLGRSRGDVRGGTFLAC